MTWLRLSTLRQKLKKLIQALRSWLAGLVVVIHLGLILLAFIAWLVITTARLWVINLTDKRAK